MYDCYLQAGMSILSINYIFFFHFMHCGNPVVRHMYLL